eukprot:CAMPEP_0195527064 /NCGR_PEP_ID=MMETSP0794_2-20130614/28509_1 /TAXON_ID=515487 /ORGANISM="Stephanopyxis turris, Strain CCMP 815" /LENGTH=165 /DNA_ID=CAMNT_0040657889 /DNA_START=121 /DNA_END=621 /DNA_ORIENTATION=+
MFSTLEPTGIFPPCGNQFKYSYKDRERQRRHAKSSYVNSRCFGTSEGDDKKNSAQSLQASSWRKDQLSDLVNKFRSGDKDEPNEINSDDELQQMWKDMESRVTKRRTLTLEERGGKSGRKNIKRTEEEAWLAAGAYDERHREESKHAKEESSDSFDGESKQSKKS